MLEAAGALACIYPFLCFPSAFPSFNKYSLGTCDPHPVVSRICRVPPSESLHASRQGGNTQCIALKIISKTINAVKAIT